MGSSSLLSLLTSDWAETFLVREDLNVIVSENANSDLPELLGQNVSAMAIGVHPSVHNVLSVPISKRDVLAGVAVNDVTVLQASLHCRAFRSGVAKIVSIVHVFSERARDVREMRIELQGFIARFRPLTIRDLAYRAFSQC